MAEGQQRKVKQQGCKKQPGKNKKSRQTKVASASCFGKIVCEKQISATDLWHIRAGCALVHSTIFLAIWLISGLDTNGMRFCYSFSKSSLIIVLNSVSDGFCTVSILVACAIATLSKKFLTPLFCFNSQVSPDSACKNQSGLLIGPVRSITGF